MLASHPLAASAPRVMPGSTPRVDQLKPRPHRPGEASFFYFDAHSRNEAVKVLPGEYFVHDEDMLITTTLGSCIAACLWDRQQRVGGMNHFMLPDGGNGGAGANGRSGGFAMELLIGEMVKRLASTNTAALAAQERAAAAKATPSGSGGSVDLF